jgi:hypothetical protein
MGERERALIERGYQLLGALRADPQVGSIRLAQEQQAVQLWFETPGGQVWHLSLESCGR